MRGQLCHRPGALRTIADWTIGQFKDWLLDCSPAEASEIGSALTAVMAAAVAKLCDVHELIYDRPEDSQSDAGRTTLGLPDTLSSRLQPNHPTDDLRGITLLIYWGLSLGAGDALIGLNPAIDTVENVSALLTQIDKVRRRTGAPTQICVLSHIKTQLACLERGAPVEDHVPEPGRHRKHADQRVRHDGRPAGPGLPDDGRAAAR